MKTFATILIAAAALTVATTAAARDRSDYLT